MLTVSYDQVGMLSARHVKSFPAIASNDYGESFDVRCR